MSLTIRRATLKDEVILIQFNAALAWETEHKKLRTDILTAGVRGVFADTSRGFYILAEDEGEILGQMMITYEWSDWRNGWFWWVQSVYVREDARRKGIFRALYQSVQQMAAADATVIGLRLYVERENTRAQTTYRALGMTETSYGLMEEYPLPGRTSDLG